MAGEAPPRKRSGSRPSGQNKTSMYHPDTRLFSVAHRILAPSSSPSAGPRRAHPPRQSAPSPGRKPQSETAVTDDFVPCGLLHDSSAPVQPVMYSALDFLFSETGSSWSFNVRRTVHRQAERNQCMSQPPSTRQTLWSTAYLHLEDSGSAVAPMARVAAAYDCSIAAYKLSCSLDSHRCTRPRAPIPLNWPSCPALGGIILGGSPLPVCCWHTIRQ